MATDITYAYAADITKAERDAAGNLVVYGNATDSTLDLDEQVADEAWLKQAMPEWARWGNLREMHQPIVAGVGKVLEEGGDGKWMLKSEVVDAGTAKKIEAGALKGYSIGIKNARVVKDKAAPGGRIVGGTIVEVSYVDRPCNPSATLMVAKAVGAENSTLTGVERPTPSILGKKKAKPVPGTGVSNPSGDSTGTTTAGDASDNPNAGKSTEADCPLCDGKGKFTPAKGQKTVTVDVSKCNSGAGTDDSLRDAKGQQGDTHDNDDEQTKPRSTSGDPKPRKKGRKVKDLTAQNADGTPAPNHAGSTGKAADIDTLMARIDSLEKRVKASGDVVDSSGKDRSGVADEDFAGPGKTFPIESQDDVSDAASLAHHAEDPAAVRAKIKSIARRKFGKGVELPPSLKAAIAGDKSAAKAADADLIKAAVDRETASLRAELETLKKTPLPGGPVLVRTQPSVSKAAEREEAALTAAHYRALSERASDRELAQGYEALAKRAEADLAK